MQLESYPSANAHTIEPLHINNHDTHGRGPGSISRLKTRATRLCRKLWGEPNSTKTVMLTPVILTIHTLSVVWCSDKGMQTYLRWLWLNGGACSSSLFVVVLLVNVGLLLSFYKEELLAIVLCHERFVTKVRRHCCSSAGLNWRTVPPFAEGVASRRLVVRPQ